MIKQKEGRAVDSRGPVDKVFEEEEVVSKAFQISNFYTNQRLNIAELKQRLELFKNKQKVTQLPPPQRAPLSQSMHQEYEKPAKEKFAQKFNGTFGELTEEKEKVILPYANKQRLSYYEDNSREIDLKRRIATPNSNYYGKDRGVEEVKQTNYRIVKEIRRYEGPTRTAQGARPYITLNPVINNQAANKHNRSRAQSHIQRSKIQNLNASKCSNSSNRKSSLAQTFGLEGIVLIQSKQNLNELQKEINSLWEHYQLLTKILVGLKEGTKNEKNAIVKYVQDVCSNRFEFIRDLLHAITRQGAQRNEHMFVKRLRKAVIQSRLLQNLSIVYVGYGICTSLEPQAHLVNFVGYCCSNVAFLIRFCLLMHSLCQGIRFSSPISHIIEVIDEFEQGSYMKILSRVSEIVLRMEQNNDVIGIVQSKLCSVMDKEFQKSVNTFLKYVDLDSKPLYEYSHYIYEFLAFHLAQKNVAGQFSFLQMAPSPYLEPVPKTKTIVIQPWMVLIAQKGKGIYLRSFSQTIIRQASKYCNIVYWTDLMPDKIDPLMQILPPGKVLYKYHCRLENDRYLKLIWRLGCDQENTIIIDRDEGNIKYDKEMGIALPWHGQRKDRKLLQFYESIQKMVMQDKSSFRKLFPSLKASFLEQKRVDRKSVHSSEQRQEESMFPVPKRKISRLRQYQY